MDRPVLRALTRSSGSGLARLLLAGVAAAQATRELPVRHEPVVRIHYDDLGIPHVFAESDAGVFRGLGYSQVRDFPVATLANLWSATGRFAEVAGASALARDERIRQWGIERRAHELATDPSALDARARVWLQAYVDGVNAGRRAWLEHPAAIRALVGPQGELFFDPVPPWLDPLRTKDAPGARLERLFSAEVGLEQVLAFGVALAAGPEFGAAGYATRTNVMMLRGGERDPALHVLADVHQPLQEFGYRTYFAQLAGPGYDLLGNTSPGFPCIVLGLNRSLAFGSMTLPKKPRELSAAKLPFRITDDLPLVQSAWRARLEPGPTPGFRRGEERVPVIEEPVTLCYWDTAQSALADDPRGPITLRWVRDSEELRLPVVEPRPDQPLDPTGTIRFEARSFLGQRSLWETWMELGTRARVGGKDGKSEPGIDAVLARESLSTGRGQLVLAADSGGDFELLWSTRAARTSPETLARVLDGVVLDGHDPEQRWLGFHGFDELPRWVGGKHGPEPEGWIACNSSPHEVRDGDACASFDGPRAVWDGEPWKTRRQDRARELFARAAADGVLQLAELERLALDVQDGWSRQHWPWIQALREDRTAPLSARARAFLAWVDEFRFEGPDGRPGDEEFLAHPLSQVMPFLALLRDRYEERLIAARPPSDALALAFDPGASLMPDAFLFEDRYRANRAALAAAVEWTAELRERTLRDKKGGLVDVAFFHALEERSRDCSVLFPEAWSDPLYSQQAPEWGPKAPPLALRWGEVNVYTLTPHRPHFDPAPRRPAQVDAWLNALFAPCAAEPWALAFHRSAPSVMFPIGGTHDSLFQVHRQALLSATEALFRREQGFLFLAPVDFGSQTLFVAELVPGARARVRVLMALAPTEIHGAIPELGRAALEPFRTTARFARGEWSDVVTDEAALRALDGARHVELGE